MVDEEAEMQYQIAKKQKDKDFFHFTFPSIQTIVELLIALLDERKPSIVNKLLSFDVIKIL